MVRRDWSLHLTTGTYSDRTPTWSIYTYILRPYTLEYIPVHRESLYTLRDRTWSIVITMEEEEGEGDKAPKDQEVDLLLIGISLLKIIITMSYTYILRGGPHLKEGIYYGGRRGTHMYMYY